MIETLKSSKADKTYKLKVTFKEPVSEEKLKSCLEVFEWYRNFPADPKACSSQAG